MPIDIEEFEAAEAVSRQSTSTAVVEFLFENRSAAFTRGEIAEALDRDPNTVGTNLSRLKRRGLVRHRGNHWAITDDHDRLLADSRFTDALAGLADDLPPEIADEADAEAWRDAQPAEPHPSKQTDSG